MKEMEHKGFSNDVLLKLEQEDWGQPQGQWSWETRAKDMGVPVDARPLATRNLRCKRGPIDLYDCDYLIDYGRSGQVEGSFSRRNMLIGKDDKGRWTTNWIVVD